MKLKYILFGIMLLFSVHVCGAANSTLAPGDVIGDPVRALNPIKDPVKWLTGFALMAFVVVSVVAIFFGGVAAQAGAIAKNAALRQHGTSSILGTIAIVISVVIAMLVFWFVITQFLL